MAPTATRERPAVPMPVTPRPPAPQTHAVQLPRLLRLGAAVAWVVIIALWALLEIGHRWRRFRFRMD